jgi:ligand-binding sensor domain-containing protein
MGGLSKYGADGFGVACLDEGGWKIFDKTNTPLSGSISGIAACAGGTTWFVGPNGLYSTDGATWARHPSASKRLNAVACDPKKGVWLAAQGGVFYYDGETLTTHAASELGTDVESVGDVAVAGDGRVWAKTGGSVATWDGSTWRFWEQGKGFKKKYLFVGRMMVDGSS